ncbi:MAG: hypothetical protein RLZZ69_458, partial [Cyanobacteriota bacterium]
MLSAMSVPTFEMPPPPIWPKLLIKLLFVNVTHNNKNKAI